MLVPSVAGRAMWGTVIPVRWRAAPSSTGAGMVLQSTVSGDGFWGVLMWG
jgi:hypothetical protein